MGKNNSGGAIAAVLVAIIGLAASPIWAPAICRAVGLCRSSPVTTPTPTPTGQPSQPPTPTQTGSIGTALDPERYSSSRTAWWYQWTDRASIDVLLDRNHARAIDVAAYGANSFSVVAVSIKKKAFARTPEGSSSWTADETVESLSNKIASGGRRLLDLERYTVASRTLFAAAWVDNNGLAAKTWYWWLDITPDTVAAKLQQCGCRLIDLDPIGNGRYDVVMIRADGVDNLPSWWYVGASQTEVSRYLSTNQARAVALEPDGSGRFAVIMVRDGIAGGVNFDRSWSELNGVQATGQRYLHIRQYTNAARASVWLSITTRNS